MHSMLTRVVKFMFARNHNKKKSAALMAPVIASYFAPHHRESESAHRSL
jgi:hypothetical protein